MSEEKQPTPEAEKKDEPPKEEPARASNRALTSGDVDDVLNITLARMNEKSAQTMAALKESSERLLNESDKARELMSRLSEPPPSSDETK